MAMNSSLKLASAFLSKNTNTSIAFRQKIPSYKFYSPGQFYGTWALSGFNFSNAARIQPVLDVEKIIQNEQMYINAIEKRKMVKKPDAKEIAKLFAEAKELNAKRIDVELKKFENIAKVQEYVKDMKVKKMVADEVKNLRVRGKELREELRVTTNKFNSINDKLVNLVLSLPNLLDSTTPATDCEILKDVQVPEGVKPWEWPKEPFWRTARPGSVGPQESFAYGGPAWLELDLAATCQQSLLKEGFVETGNVDLVRRILLEGACLDPKQFLRIREHTVKSGMAHATYLVGGASFPAFLALFSQTVIFSDDVFPIKYFVIGRSYVKPTEYISHRTIQSSAIQVFVACKTEEQQEEEFLKLTDFMESFYSKTVGLSFQAKLLSAPQLRTFERKKIAFILNDNKKQVGDLTTIGDYVSKRLLCCFADEHRVPRFLHMITGQFFDLSGFLRPELPAPPPFTSVPVKVDKVKEIPKPMLITGWINPEEIVNKKKGSSSYKSKSPNSSGDSKVSPPPEDK